MTRGDVARAIAWGLRRAGWWRRVARLHGGLPEGERYKGLARRELATVDSILHRFAPGTRREWRTRPDLSDYDGGQTLTLVVTWPTVEAMEEAHRRLERSVRV